jgi:hypothetical protein
MATHIFPFEFITTDLLSKVSFLITAGVATML